MNNTFNIPRFGLLIRKHLIESYKLYLIPLAAFMGCLFIIMFAIHIFDRQLAFNNQFKESLYQLSFVAAGILYTGTSYTSFRSKESTMSYLLVPSTRLEKFTFEYLSRILLFFLLAPIAYWLVANLELIFASTLFQKLEFYYQPIRFLWYSFNVDLPIYGYVSNALFVLMLFNMVFVGAIQYMKQPIVKTLFRVALIWLLYATFIICSIYLFDTRAYHPISDFELSLIPIQEHALEPFTGRVFFAINFTLIIVSYLKFKEKQV